MSTDNLGKFKKAIATEKASVSNKTFSIDKKPIDRFSKATEFLEAIEPALIKVKTKLIKNSFLLPEDEYMVITNTMRVLIDKGIITKPTDVFRIALAILNNADHDLILNTYEQLNKVSPGKPKQNK